MIATRSTARLAAGALFLAALAACAGPADRAVMLEGAETSNPTANPRVATAVMTPAGASQRMELVAADGTVLVGDLSREQRPILVPLAAAGGGAVGGDTELVGTISGGGRTLDCRFRLLNPSRGVDGGGSGRCDGADGRTVEFLF